MSSSSWSATGRDWSVSWAPSAPHLTGSPEVVSAILAELAKVAKVDVIRITPTSASVPANAAEPAAALAALNRARSSFTLKGSPPAFPSEPGLVY